MKLCLVTLAKQLVNITRKTKEIIFFFIHISFNVVESQYERQGPWRVSMDLALWILFVILPHFLCNYYYVPSYHCSLSCKDTTFIRSTITSAVIKFK